MARRFTVLVDDEAHRDVHIRHLCPAKSVRIRRTHRTPASEAQQHVYNEAAGRAPGGFLISGVDGCERRPQLFTWTRASAERIAARLRAGDEVQLADFQAGDPCDLITGCIKHHGHPGVHQVAAPQLAAAR